MSFLGTSHRSYEPLSQSDIPHLARTQISPLNNFDGLSSSIMHPLVHGSAPHAQNHIQPLTDRSQITLPKVGQTRCYWALLSSNLSFLYLDPVLAHHLGPQADRLISKSLLEFVHPDEQRSAEQDLGGVLDSRTLHGSVTRVRFSRLSRVRRELGYQGPGPLWSDAEKIALDENYMAVDIVINWAADGVVLCFIHAVVDLTPRDNDEHNKTGWTNWCGTPYMGQDQVQLLFQRLCNTIPHTDSMDRVFQILLNQPDRALYCSWPPDRSDPVSPSSKDFAKLAADVNIGTTGNSGTDAKTSCTRRYKAQQTMQYGVEGVREVESIFIPYGSIIFACHKVGNQTTTKNGSGYLPNTGPPYYEDPAYSLPPLNVQPDYQSTAYSSQHTSPQYPSGNWSANSENAQPPFNQWTPQQHANVASSPSQQHQWSSQPPTYMEANGSAAYPFSGAVSYSGSSTAGTPTTDTAPAASEEPVPAARTTSRRASNKDGFSGGRAAGNPPVGIMKCSSCKVTHSPEWRKGPSGKKDLCNACGLRYARSRAKKEGGPTRRRKDKILATMASKSEHSPSASPVNAPYNGMRRGSGYEESAFAQGSAGSSSGTEVYPPPHAQHAPPHAPQLPGMNGMTPSPSPPSATGNSFASYPASHPQDHHQNSQPMDPRTHSHYTSSYYHNPSQITGSMVHHNNTPSQHILPPLDSVTGMPYSNRLSPPTQSPSSPMPGSHFVASSYERDRHYEDDRKRLVLPPTPVSADPRGGPPKY